MGSAVSLQLIWRRETALPCPLCHSGANFQLRIAESQPTIPADMLNLVYQSIERIQIEIPAMERSIQEVKTE